MTTVDDDCTPIIPHIEAHIGQVEAAPENPKEFHGKWTFKLKITTGAQVDHVECPFIFDTRELAENHAAGARENAKRAVRAALNSGGVPILVNLNERMH